MSKDYDPAQYALNHLEKHNGKVETAFEDLWIEKNGQLLIQQSKLLWQVSTIVLMRSRYLPMSAVLRLSICIVVLSQCNLLQFDCIG
ncbi:hypothetical protein [Nostoc sp.]|uniref:hypothetical protein n=1 Tax=Nostoc sp. TaxID=1180 RepID=UPI002FFAB5BD